MATFPSWDHVLQHLSRRAYGTVVRIPRRRLPHPRTTNMVRSAGLWKGQAEDWRFRLRDCTGFHVHVYTNHYEAHLDRVHPECDLVEHLRHDAPGAYVATTTVGGGGIGAGLGALIGGKEGAVVGGLFGALVGGLFGAATVDP